MEKNQETAVRPVNVSFNKFWIQLENQFIVLDDAEHVIGVDARDRSKLILENLKNGSTVRFAGRNSILFPIFTMVFDEESRSLYCGYQFGRLHQYEVDTLNQTCKKVRDFGNLGIGCIRSCQRFMQFVFFAGSQSKIRILDLSTGELLPGYFKTSIKWIYSLQVSVKSANEIFLAVSGGDADYSEDKTDLFDLSGLLGKDPAILRKFTSQYLNNEACIEQQSIIESQADMIKKLTKERDQYKAKFTEMESKYNDTKEKYDLLYDQKEEMIKSYNALKSESEIKTRDFVKKIKIMYNHKRTRTKIGAFGSIIENKLSEETNHEVIISNLIRDLEEKRKLIKHHQKTTYEAVNICKAAEEEAERFRESLQAAESQLLRIRDVIGQR